MTGSCGGLISLIDEVEWNSRAPFFCCSVSQILTIRLWVILWLTERGVGEAYAMSTFYSSATIGIHIHSHSLWYCLGKVEWNWLKTWKHCFSIQCLDMINWCSENFWVNLCGTTAPAWMCKLLIKYWLLSKIWNPIQGDYEWKSSA